MTKAQATLLLLLLLPLGGCFTQRAFPADLQRIQPITPRSGSQQPATTRAWLRHAQPQLAPLLPAGRHGPLLTEDLLTADGKAVDVFAHFDRNPKTLHTLFGNLTGLSHSAQATGADTSEGIDVAPWPGFEDVWVPVAPGLEYAARLGLALQDGKPRPADCIVVLPGILGDLAVWRTRDLSIALREAGYHVLAVEMRGMGGTNQRYPEVHCMFGALEADDLIAVATWAQAKPFVRDTGLVGFCWGANEALTTVWTIGRGEDDPDLTPGLRPLMRPVPDTPVYAAGVMAFSPVLRYEEIVAACETPTSVLSNPVINSLQGTVTGRMQQKKHREINGDLGKCIQFEFERHPEYYPGMVADALRHLRLLPFEDKPCSAKLNGAPMPVLIVQGEDDPLTSAQNVADLIELTRNPNVAAVVLPGGGHVGFAPYARDYFYSLIIGFFDPQAGAAAFSASRAPERPGRSGTGRPAGTRPGAAAHSAPPRGP